MRVIAHSRVQVLDHQFPKPEPTQFDSGSAVILLEQSGLSGRGAISDMWRLGVSLALCFAAADAFSTPLASRTPLRKLPRLAAAAEEGRRGRSADRLRKRLKSSPPPKADPEALASEAKVEMARRLAAEEDAKHAAEAEEAAAGVSGGWEYVAAKPAPPVSDEELEAIMAFMNGGHVEDLLLYVQKWTDIGKGEVF